jgi:hypothetical protein
MLLASCGGGGGAPAPTPAPPPTSPGPAPTPSPGGLFTAPAQEALTTADVQRVIAQAAAEATAQGKPAGIAVVDRVGNVLAFYAMNGADLSLRIIDPPRGGPRVDFISCPSFRLRQRRRARSPRRSPAPICRPAAMRSPPAPPA